MKKVLSDAERRMVVSSPAKINLDLRITGRRSDGFHDLWLLNTGVDLADEVEVELYPGNGVLFECDHPAVPLGEDNLCVRSARAFMARAAVRDTGIRIRLVKRVPVAAGLGGGSGNAAAVLWALDRLTGAGLSERELIEIGATLGADVPFFLYRSPAWARGKGEILSPAPALPGWHYLLVSFNFGVSAAWAFGQWDLTSAPSCDTLSIPKGEDPIPMPGTWKNDLEAVVSARYPEIIRVKKALIQAGAMQSLMSGSGPTVFGVFENLTSPATLLSRLDVDGVVNVFSAHALQGPLLRKLE